MYNYRHHSMQIMHFYRPKLHYLTLRSSFGHFFFSMVTPFCPRALASSEQGYPEIIHRGTGRSTHPRSTLGNRREAFHFLHSLERCRTWVTQTVGKFCSPFLFIRITSKLVPSPFSFECNALLQPIEGSNGNSKASKANKKKKDVTLARWA